MYRRNFKVALFGLDDDVARAIAGIEPPEHFAIEVASATAVDLEAARESSIAVADLDALGSTPLAELSQAAREGAVGLRGLIVVADPARTAGWTAADYALVDAIWPAPLAPERAAFEFGHIIGRAKRQADHFITEAYLDTLIDSMPEMVWFKANDGEHVKVNSYFCDIVDKPRDDVEGQFHNYIWNVPREDWEKAELTCKASDDKAVQAGTTVRCDENVSTHGEIRLFDTYKTPIYDEDGTVLGTTGFAHDVTVERELARQAWLNARTDYLTGLFNRRYFYEYLEEHAGDGPFTFVLVDLDDFKGINDGSGHDAGDEALLAATDVLHGSFPECPIVRWGGDEFVAVVPAADEALAGDGNVNAFQEALRDQTAARCPYALTASIGIARQAADETVDAAVKRADDALYEAKTAGKARHVRANE